jgi:putative membrane protein
MLRPVLNKNDKHANILIIGFSIIVFGVVAALGNFHLNIHTNFNVHLFALLNAVINSCVAILLLSALFAVKKKKYLLHKKLMLTAIALSVLFLASYILHHILADETKFGGTGFAKIFYLIILATHILSAGLSLPFILFTAYRALTAEFTKHKKLARIVFPVWLYVSVTGVIVYLMISPCYK